MVCSGRRGRHDEREKRDRKGTVTPGGVTEPAKMDNSLSRPGVEEANKGEGTKERH